MTSLRQQPERLLSDYSSSKQGRVRCNLLFYTHHPMAWHTALCCQPTFKSTRKIKKGTEIIMSMCKIDLTINLYANGTVMIQGAEKGLSSFHSVFPSLKQTVEVHRLNSVLLEDSVSDRSERSHTPIRQPDLTRTLVTALDTSMAELGQCLTQQPITPISGQDVVRECEDITQVMSAAPSPLPPQKAQTPGCNDCLSLRRKVAELERRLSLLDNPAASNTPAVITTASTGVTPANQTIPWQNPGDQHADHWSNEAIDGAKLLDPSTSTPMKEGSWTTPRGGGHSRGSNSPPEPSHTLLLTNRFTPLESLTPSLAQETDGSLHLPRSSTTVTMKPSLPVNQHIQRGEAGVGAATGTADIPPPRGEQRSRGVEEQLRGETHGRPNFNWPNYSPHPNYYSTSCPNYYNNYSNYNPGHPYYHPHPYPFHPYLNFPPPPLLPFMHHAPRFLPMDQPCNATLQMGPAAQHLPPQASEEPPRDVPPQPNPNRPSASPKPTPPDANISTLVIGSSMVKDIHLPSSLDGLTKVHCVHGARVQDLHDKLPGILTCYPEVKNIILHVSVDPGDCESVTMKNSLTALTRALKATGKRIFISGPLPSHSDSHERGSGLHPLHKWLQAHCALVGATFISNYDLIWKCPNLMEDDGLHPTQRGARVLSQKMVSSLRQGQPIKPSATQPTAHSTNLVLPASAATALQTSPSPSTDHPHHVSLNTSGPTAQTATSETSC